MKGILFTVCILFACIVTSVAQEGSYKIEGRLDASVNGHLLLVADTEHGAIDIGDVVITNGVFEFTGRMPEVTVTYLMTSKKDVILATIMLENTDYTITGGSNEWIVEGGGEAQKIWNEFNELNKYLMRSQQQLEEKARTTVNSAQLQKLQQEFQEIVAKVEAEELALLQKYRNSVVAAYMAAVGIQRGMDEIKLTERYNALDENVKTTFYGKRLADELVKMQNVAVGVVAPDFTAPLADGGVLSLHEAPAKVKIVNFWASWSAPCREENVNFLTMYKRYRPKGLEIISVSIDVNRQAWLSAIGQDGSNWKNVSDLKGQASEIAAAYRVRTIPCTFILDEDNRIVAKNLHGKELEKMIVEMLKKKK